MENFSLPDFHGQPHSLDEYQGKLVVVAFLGVDCPLAKNYALRLRDLAAEFESQGVAFVGIDSNVQDSLTEIATYALVHGVTFPVLKDNNNVIADRLGAERTPEVFLLDRARVIRYWGRIDDQYGFKTGAGYVKPKLTERNLADAISEVLAGNQVTRPVVKAAGCFIGRVSKKPPHGDVTYTNQIARILQNRCVECHRTDEVAPFSLTSYEEVAAWAETIREVVQQGRMPPWFADPRYGHFKNDARLNDQEKQQICDWVENGCPQGDPADLPDPRKFATGWLMGEPDQVIYMRNRPFTVPAEGLVAYQYYTVDPGWTTDKWIQAVEVRPGNRSVVHHIRVDVVAENLSEGFTRDIGSYVPGSIPNQWPAGSAVYVPAHSKLSFELHYTPNGVEQDDRSMVGVRFADPASVKRLVNSRVVDNITFRIPPNDPNYEVKSEYLFQRDANLLFLWPHMHLRGKSFQFEAAYPDGRREVLLDIPNYDFNWQLRYVYDEPKLMPRGTRLHCTAHFDNSAENLSNPDPTRAVTASEQTWDEMMQGNFSAIYPGEDPACVALVALSRAAPANAEDALDLAATVNRLLELGARADKDSALERGKLYRRLKATYPFDRRIDYAWALTLVNQGRYKDAIAELTQYLYLGGELGAHSVKIWTQLLQKDYADALAEARALVDRFPTKPPVELLDEYRDAARILGILFAYLELVQPDTLTAQRAADQEYVSARLVPAYADDYTAGRRSVSSRWEATKTDGAGEPVPNDEERNAFSTYAPLPYERERERIMQLFIP
ncbi:MAG TPA: redoxin domain-containing protein [Pirellulales bacterium]